MITEEAPSFHYPPANCILYVGQDLTLLKLLQDGLDDCAVIRCPIGSVAGILIASKINYLLLLFDEQMPDMTGDELAGFVRTLAHREGMPVIIFKPSDDFNSIVRAIDHLLREV
jgi:DNA-binding response OmpR family regulator